MSKFSNSEQTRLANQFNEIKEKEEKAIADKAAKLERDMQLIKESRSEQIRAKQEAIAKEKREKDIMVAKWKEQKEEAGEYYYSIYNILIIYKVYCMIISII